MLSYAQFQRGQQVNGAIYLDDGAVLTAPFIYYEKEQAILKQDSLLFEVYTTFHVDSFVYYDPELMWQRKFRKLEYKHREQFFEVVAPGELEILRLKLPHNAPERIIKNELDRHRLDYHYFVWHQGKLSSLNSYKPKHLKKNYPQLWKETRKYIRDHNFGFYKMHHKIQIIQKVNDLLDSRITISE